jgi:hypothetical protein
MSGDHSLLASEVIVVQGEEYRSTSLRRKMILHCKGLYFTPCAVFLLKKLVEVNFTCGSVF